MSKFQDLYQQYVANKAGTKAQQNRCHEIVRAIFDEFPDVNFCFVSGYTPSWNDGEPCTHSHDVYVGTAASGYGDAEQLASVVEATFGPPFYVEGVEVGSGEGADDPHRIPAPASKRSANADHKKAVALLDAAPLQAGWDTNFHLAWMRDPTAPEGIRFVHAENDLD